MFLWIQNDARVTPRQIFSIEFIYFFIFLPTRSNLSTLSDDICLADTECVFYCGIEGLSYTNLPFDSLLVRLNSSTLRIQYFSRHV